LAALVIRIEEQKTEQALLLNEFRIEEQSVEETEVEFSVLPK
jgi:hypothetical protein